MAPEFQPSSFRDRSCRVFEWQGQIYRALSAESAASHRRLLQTPFFIEAVLRGDIIQTVPADDLTPLALAAGFESAVRHARIPLISWPWEWSFSMLREAALLHLQLMQHALHANWILCDASAFNIQFHGQQPVLIDTGSFVPLTPGTAWDGYRQFCQHFLFPLMLQAWKSVDFQPWFRGRIDGIPPEQFSNLLSLRDLLRPGALSHVWLHGLLARRNPARQAVRQPVRQSLNDAGFSKDMILHNLSRLKKIISQLSWQPKHSAWTHYQQTAPHVPADHPVKANFVHEVCSRLKPHVTWDLGCNLGTFSRIAAEFGHVAALDADHPTIDRFFNTIRSQPEAHTNRILPLVHNVADPAPSLGWRGTERTSLEHRSKPRLVLALAVLHHLVITAGLRLEDVISWLRSLNAPVVLEWVDRSDPMVLQLLQNRSDVFSDFHYEFFLAAVNQHFHVARSLELQNGNRRLFLLEPAETGASCNPQ